jgi:outer membrane protein
MISHRETRTRLLATAVIVVAFHFPARAMSLEDALVSAYSSNPQLAAARAQQRKAAEGVPQALAAGRPTVQAQGGLGATNGAAASGANSSANGSQTETRVGPVGALTVSVPLWTAGRVDAALAGARSRIAAGGATLLVSEQDVLLRTATAYVDVLRAQKVLDVEHQHEVELAGELASAKRRLAAGELRAADIAATDARHAQAEARLTQAQGDLEAVREVFRGIVGVQPDDLQPPDMPPGLPGSRDKELAASADNPSLAAAAQVVASARSAVDGAQAQLRPSVAAQASLGVPYSSGEVLLTVPLFDGGLAESQSRGAKQELQQRRLELEAQRNAVRQDAVSAWQALTTARAAIEADRTQVAASRSARDSLRREQAQGLRTQLEVLDADQRLLDAELALVGAQREVVVAAYRILAASGHLTAADLGLPVQRYDPGRYVAETGAPLWDRHEIGEAYLGGPKD